MNLQTSRFWGHLMTKKPKKTGGYDVGYGKPPEHTKWKKGQSGNPSGKKKKEADLLDTIKKIASEELIVHKHGVPHSMTCLEAAVYALFAMAQSGHPQAFKLIAAHSAVLPPPPVIGLLRHPDLPDSVRGAHALALQHLNLPQLYDDILGLLALP